MKELLFSAWDVVLRFTGAAGGAAAGGNLPVMAALMGLNLFLPLFLKAGRERMTFSLLLRRVLEKAAVFGVILLASWLDRIGGKGSMLRSAAIGFYTCQEGLTLLKNAAALGVPIPSALKKAAESLMQANA